MATTKKIPFFVELTDTAGNPVLIKTADISAVVRDDQGFTVLMLSNNAENLIVVSETYEQVKAALLESLNSVN